MRRSLSLLTYAVALTACVLSVGETRARDLSQNPENQALGSSDSNPASVQSHQTSPGADRARWGVPRSPVTLTLRRPHLPLRVHPQLSLMAREDSTWEAGLDLHQRTGRQVVPLFDFPESAGLEEGKPGQPSYEPISFVHPWAAATDPYALPAGRLISPNWSFPRPMGLQTKEPALGFHSLSGEEDTKPVPTPEGAWLPQRIEDVRASWLTWRYSSLFEPLGLMGPASDGNDIGDPANQLAIVRNSSVDRQLHFFHTAISDRFQEWLLRLNRYQPMVEAIFDQFNIPKELVYLSLVESGFNPHAYSRSRAVGPWQFIRSTARLYGLRVDRYVDERRDPIKSTIAAARYLKDLYDLFGTWPLAMAAYNAGEGRVSRALARTSGESYWTIARTRLLHRETKNYVPRFMAATIIASAPDTYGFVMNSNDFHRFEEVVVPPLIHLRSVAQATGIAYAELKHLNPELRRNLTPPDSEGYLLKVPIGTSALVLEHLDKIRSVTSHRYRVRWGDTLSTIARQYSVTVSELKAFNNLRTNVIRAGQVLVVHPTGISSSIDDNETRRYRVRWGDNLSSIAQRFGVSVSQLKALNNLRSNYIRAGELLLLGSYGEGRPSDKPAWYRVRWGDSLWTIAKRFRTTVEQLKTFNNLTHNFIKAGDMLRIGP